MRRALPLFACLALIMGCSNKSDTTGSRVSDTELLKLNQQCRDAADKYVKDGFETYGDVKIGYAVDSVKYSQTYRRCLAVFMKVKESGGNRAFSMSLTDPISNDNFAERTDVSDFFKQYEDYRVDPSMKGNQGGGMKKVRDIFEYDDFLKKVMTEP